MTEVDVRHRISNFYNEWSFLSNFAASQIGLLHYPNGSITQYYAATVEHAFQALKTVVTAEFEAILEAKTPGEAKKLGRRATLRPDWEQVKDGVMLDLLRVKFENPWMREHLLETGNAVLIEGNTWHDNYWGDCHCNRMACAGPAGKNMLGKLLMQVRAEIRG